MGNLFIVVIIVVISAGLSYAGTLNVISIQELDINGYGWLRGVVPIGDLTRLREECLRAVKPGERLNATPILREVLGEKSAMSVLISKVMPSARPVRLVSFAKSGQQNWALP